MLRRCRGDIASLLTPGRHIAGAQILEGGIEAFSAVDPSVPKYAKYTPNFKF
jgi:hypothetical protein